MPVDDIRILLFALAFGGLMGWGMGRRAEDRRPTLVASGLILVVGIVCWIVALAVDAEPSGGLTLAAASLTAGGVGALALLLMFGRR